MARTDRDAAVVFANVRVLFEPTPVDIVIERGKITRVGKGAAAGLPASTIVDAKDRWALPGFVDLHAHFREPGFESKEDIASGLRSAARGGFVDVCAMPNTDPVNDHPAITKRMKDRAAEVGGPRLHPIGAITVGQRGEALAELGSMKEAGAVAASDDGRCVTSSAVMRRAMEYARTIDLPLIQHAEDHALTKGAEMHEGAVATRLGLRGWPSAAEDVIVARDLVLAEYTKSKYHLAHVSTRGAIRLLREAKSRGLPVSAEVTPHHLLLTHEAVGEYRTLAKVNPPLREQEDVAELRRALTDGTIDCIATDHAPHGASDKSCSFADALPGMIGLECAFSLILSLVNDGVLSLEQLVRLMSTQPSKIVGLPAPSLAVGSPADFTLVDLEATWDFVPPFASKSANSPFLGHKMKGRVVRTLVGGETVFELETTPS